MAFIIVCVALFLLVFGQWKNQPYHNHHYRRFDTDYYQNYRDYHDYRHYQDYQDYQQPMPPYPHDADYKAEIHRVALRYTIIFIFFLCLLFWWFS